MDIVDRMFDLLSNSGISQQDFANQIGVKKNAITKWKNGESRSFTKYIPQIAEALGTTTEYLLTGTGLKQKRTVSDSDTKPDWMVKFEELSPGAQKEVIAFIEFKRGQE